MKSLKIILLVHICVAANGWFMWSITPLFEAVKLRIYYPRLNNADQVATDLLSLWRSMTNVFLSGHSDKIPDSLILNAAWPVPMRWRGLAGSYYPYAVISEGNQMRIKHYYGDSEVGLKLIAANPLSTSTPWELVFYSSSVTQLIARSQQNVFDLGMQNSFPSNSLPK